MFSWSLAALHFIPQEYFIIYNIYLFAHCFLKSIYFIVVLFVYYCHLLFTVHSVWMTVCLISVVCVVVVADIAGCSNCAQILPVFVCLVLCADFLTIMFSLFSAQCCLSSHSAAVHCLRFHSSVVVISYYRYSLSLLFNWHIFNVHPFDHDLQRTTGKSLGTLDVFTIFMWIAFVSYNQQ